VLGDHTFATISAGGAHTCAKTTAGAVYCWGDNGRGQLGNPTATTLATVPVISYGPSAAAGWAHGCGLVADGRAFCWGDNEQGQGGQPGPGSSYLATGISGGFTFASLSTGGVHTCAVRAADNVAMCWGDNAGGKLGAGTGADRGLPRPVWAPLP
jgi:alpha-tubulin suppressor-like RCC1 family protein